MVFWNIIQKKRLSSSKEERAKSRERAAWIVICLFFLIHALISSLVCYCCDCFLGLFVELLATHLSFLKCIRVWRFAVLIYSFFSVCLALCARLAHSLIHSLVHSQFVLCTWYIFVVIEFIFHLLFRRHNIQCIIHSRSTLCSAHTHAIRSIAEERDRKKKKNIRRTNFFKNNSNCDLRCMVLGAFLFSIYDWWKEIIINECTHGLFFDAQTWYFFFSPLRFFVPLFVCCFIADLWM